MRLEERHQEWLITVSRVPEPEEVPPELPQVPFQPQLTDQPLVSLEKVDTDRLDEPHQLQFRVHRACQVPRPDLPPPRFVDRVTPHLLHASSHTDPSWHRGDEQLPAELPVRVQFRRPSLAAEHMGVEEWLENLQQLEFLPKRPVLRRRQTVDRRTKPHIAPHQVLLELDERERMDQLEERRRLLRLVRPQPSFEEFRSLLPPQ